MMRVKNIFCILLVCVYSFAEGYSLFQDNGKVGLKNEAGKVIIPAKYDALGWSNGKFSVLSNATGYRSGEKWGLISLTNQLITSADFEEVSPADASLILARKKSPLSLRIVTGVINTSGKEVIPFQYDEIKLSSLRAIVFSKVGDQYRYGVVDLDNKTVIPQVYKNVRAIGSLRYAAEKFDNKWVLFTESGKQITTFDIDSIGYFKKDYAIIRVGDLRGLIDRNGAMKIAPRNQELRINGDGTVSVREPATWLFLNGDNKLSKKVSADSVGEIAKNLLGIKTSGLIQLADFDLKPIGKTKISMLGKFSNGKAVFSVDDKYGVVGQDGKVILEAKYSGLRLDKNFYHANNKQAGKDNWVALNSEGNPLHTKSYDEILPFNGAFFPVISKNFWGAIDKNGEQFISCTYDSILQQRDDKIVVKFHGQYGIINHREHWIVPPKSGKVVIVGEDRLLEYGPKTAYLKSMRNDIIYFSENHLEVVDDKLIEYLPSGTIWTIGMNGVIIDRKVMPDQVEKIFPESEGLRGIKKNGQFGFIDSQGRLRIANRYEDIQPFSERLAAMKIRGKWGFIGHDDKIAIQPIYDEVKDFKNGLSVVKQKGFFGVIDPTGKQVLLPRYESVEVLPHRNIIINQNKLFGLADPQGKIFINPKYDQLKDLNNGYIIVERAGKYGAINAQGVSTIPLIYDYISYDSYNDIFLAKVNTQWTEVVVR